MSLALPSSFTTLGLDLSLTATGIVVWDGERVLRHKLVATAPKDGQDELRIAMIVKEIRRVIRLHVPNLTLIENYGFSKNTGGGSKLMELGGVVKNTLWKLGLPFDVKASTTIKKHATGNGKAKKPEMIAAAKRVWPGCPDNDNIADAFWLANYAYVNYDSIVLDAPQTLE